MYGLRVAVAFVGRIGHVGVGAQASEHVVIGPLVGENNRIMSKTLEQLCRAT